MEDQVTAVLEQIGSLLHEAGETHHRVFRIVDGADDDWASWYADWLINLSELPALLGVKPVCSELTYLLVSLDKEYTTTQPGEPWERHYAQRILASYHTARSTCASGADQCQSRCVIRPLTQRDAISPTRSGRQQRP